MSNMKMFLIMLGYSIMLASTMLMCVIYYLLSVNPRIWVDAPYGEAPFEFVISLYGIVFGIYAMIKTFK